MNRVWRVPFSQYRKKPVAHLIENNAALTNTLCKPHEIVNGLLAKKSLSASLCKQCIALKQLNGSRK